MTNQEPVTSITENLRLGIEAARSNQVEKARAYLARVLSQAPNHIPAMFWLAFVAPSPYASIDLFNRILNLEPGNERARAGIRWAEQRLEAASTGSEEEKGEAGVVAAQADQAKLPNEFLRQQLLSKDDTHQRAKKSAAAHRARRTIDPLLVAIIIVGAANMLGLGLWALIFGPPETLAAWLPVAVDREAAQVSPAMTPANKAPPSLNNFSTKADTIILKPAGEMSLAPSEALAPLTASEPGPSETGEGRAALVTAETNSQPVELIGPAEQILAGLQLLQPVPASILVHQPASPDEKWIEVDVTKQQVTAWEGNTPVMSFATSTGLPNTPTVLGKFNIYWKLKATLMVGPGYYLPEVPYTMYFYAGYALHGAYWHNNFGQPMSHGCVNLSIDDSKTLFEWADPVIPPGQTQMVSSTINPGTLVVVHD